MPLATIFRLADLRTQRPARVVFRNVTVSYEIAEQRYRDIAKLEFRFGENFCQQVVVGVYAFDIRDRAAR